jgi:hypothetical protein
MARPFSLSIYCTHIHIHTYTNIPELLQVDDVERADVVGFAAEMVVPVALSPELESEGLLSGGAEGRVRVGLAYAYKNMYIYRHVRYADSIAIAVYSPQCQTYLASPYPIVP